MKETLKERKIYRILTDVGTKAWDKIAFWTTAKSVDAEDGRNLQTKVGAINGITSDINGESDNIAASIKCVKQLNNKFGGMRFGVDGDGNYGYYGADGSLIPFSKSKLYYLGTGSSHNVSHIKGFENFTKENFIMEYIGSSYGGAFNNVGTVAPNVAVVGSKNYDPSTGKVTLNLSTSTALFEGGTQTRTLNMNLVKTYLVVGNVESI